MKISAFLWAVAVFLISHGLNIGFAQQTVGFPTALELARKNNPDWKAAEQEIEMARGKLTTAHVRLGNLYVKQKRFSDAVEVLKQANNLNPNDPSVYFNLGIAYEGIGKNEQSLGAFKKAVELNPSSAPAHYNLGTLLTKMGNYHEAVRSLSEAIRLNPQFSDAFYNLAAAYAHLGDKAKAVKELKKAVELNSALASEARKDDDFKSLHQDPEFLALTRQ